MIKFVRKLRQKFYEAKVGELRYGTAITGIPGHEDIIYIKVNARQCGCGVRVSKPCNSSVLFNPEIGSLRAVPGHVIVTVLSGEAKTEKAEAKNYLK